MLYPWTTYPRYGDEGYRYSAARGRANVGEESSLSKMERSRLRKNDSCTNLGTSANHGGVWLGYKNV